ncbi:hypothetical protein VP01_876g1 [Puccinia sorghi]|uniref:Uncharacterized protein n=1 Tax=Puccinia sorghi TaxID=27349 RepID=A0A0L6U9A2_9BASI|nr:hypothetical protein VP01_876g1 [Puccinia sorghi]
MPSIILCYNKIDYNICLITIKCSFIPLQNKNSFLRTLSLIWDTFLCGVRLWDRWSCKAVKRICKQTLKKKLAQLLAVDMLQLCQNIHTCKQVEFGCQLGWSMLHVNCRQKKKLIITLYVPIGLICKFVIKHYQFLPAIKAMRIIQEKWYFVGNLFLQITLETHVRLISKFVTRILNLRSSSYQDNSGKMVFGRKNILAHNFVNTVWNDLKICKKAFLIYSENHFKLWLWGMPILKVKALRIIQENGIFYLYFLARKMVFCRKLVFNYELNLESKMSFCRKNIFCSSFGSTGWIDLTIDNKEFEMYYEKNLKFWLWDMSSLEVQAMRIISYKQDLFWLKLLMEKFFFLLENFQICGNGKLLLEMALLSLGLKSSPVTLSRPCHIPAQDSLLHLKNPNLLLSRIAYSFKKNLGTQSHQDKTSVNLIDQYPSINTHLPSFQLLPILAFISQLPCLHSSLSIILLQYAFSLSHSIPNCGFDFQQFSRHLIRHSTTQPLLQVIKSFKMFKKSIIRGSYINKTVEKIFIMIKNILNSAIIRGISINQTVEKIFIIIKNIFKTVSHCHKYQYFIEQNKFEFFSEYIETRHAPRPKINPSSIVQGIHRNKFPTKYHFSWIILIALTSNLEQSNMHSPSYEQKYFCYKLPLLTVLLTTPLPYRSSHILFTYWCGFNYFTHPQAWLARLTDEPNLNHYLCTNQSHAGESSASFLFVSLASSSSISSSFISSCESCMHPSSSISSSSSSSSSGPIGSGKFSESSNPKFTSVGKESISPGICERGWCKLSIC